MTHILVRFNGNGAIKICSELELKSQCALYKITVLMEGEKHALLKMLSSLEKETSVYLSYQDLKSTSQKESSLSSEVDDSTDLEDESQNISRVSDDFDGDDSTKDEDYEPSSLSSNSSDSFNNHISLNVELLQDECIGHQENGGELRKSKSCIVSGKTKEVTQTPSTSIRNTQRTKLNCCIFCKKLISKLTRHFETIHKNEEMVKQYVSLPKRCSERMKMIAKLRLEGNYIYNTENKNTDKILVARKLKNKSVNASNYLPCPKCKIFLTRGALRRHYRNCESQRRGTKSRNILIQSKSVLGNIHPIACETLKKYVYPVIKDDKYNELMRYDKLLIIYGNAMCQKYRDQHHYDMIRSRMRMMARFLFVLKTLNQDITDFQSIYNPKHFNSVVDALHEMGNFDRITGHYEKATLPCTVGTALKYIGALFISECIKSQDDLLKKQIEDLLTLLKTDLQNNVNKTVNETLLHRKRQKRVTLPSTEDIKKFNLYLLENCAKYYRQLKDEFSIKSWLRLSEYTLVSILLFNRRRPGELERTLMSDYQNCQSINQTENNDIFQSLSANGQCKAKEYVRFVIRGKLARGVPVLLHKHMRKCIDVIVKYRNEAGVHLENPYIFGIPQSKSGKNQVFRYLRAAALVRKFSSNCGASNPGVLRATQLRKHIATQSALLNLRDQDVERLQDFLGHADKIHKNIYRQPLLKEDILKMTKLLEKAQGQEIETKTNTKQSSSSASSNLLSERSESESYTSQNAVHESENSPHLMRKHSLPVSSTPFKRETSSKGESSGQKKRSRLLDIDLGVVKRRSWSTPERECARSTFSEYIQNQAIPSYRDCLNLVKNKPSLTERTIPQIRAWVVNQINGSKTLGIPKRKSWGTPERQAVRKLFAKYINTDSPCYPSLEEIKRTVKNYKELQNRTPKKIKSQIQHLRKKVLQFD